MDGASNSLVQNQNTLLGIDVGHACSVTIVFEYQRLSRSSVTHSCFCRVRIIPKHVI
jgi:hypothetical protein